MDLIEMLHPRISEASLEEFNKGSWLGAIRSACAEVDHAIRELVGDLDTSRYVPTSTIVKEMFGVGKETIRTIGLIPNASKRDIEKARKDLEHIINGVLGYYRNPPMHQNIRLDSLQSARIMIICSEILSEIDACEISFHRIGIDGLMKMVDIKSKEQLATAINLCDFDDFINDDVIFRDCLKDHSLELWQIDVLERCGLVECEKHDCYDDNDDKIDEIFRYQVTPLGKRLVSTLQ